jgi:hypothetical protein
MNTTRLIIGKNDSRMTPNTFEGYTLTGSFGGKDGAPGIRRRLYH